MPKATIEEHETEAPPESEAGQPPEPEQSASTAAIPEEPVEEEVPVPKKARAKAKATAKASTRKDAPKKTNLKDRHTCGACGQEMSLHTALY